MIISITPVLNHCYNFTITQSSTVKYKVVGHIHCRLTTALLPHTEGQEKLIVTGK